MTAHTRTHLPDSVSGSVISLADQLASRIPQPLDPLATAAVVESLGITDDVARLDYGEADTFGLAQQAFPLTVAIARGRTGDRPEADEPRTKAGAAERRGLGEAALSPVLALVPLVLLLVTTRLLGAEGWRIGSLLALSVGVSVGMLLTSGPLLALGRRSAIYRGFGYRAVELGLLRRGSLALLGLVVLAAAPGYAGARAIGSPHEAVVFAASMLAFSAVWILATALVLGRRRRCLTAAPAVATAAGLAGLLLHADPVALLAAVSSAGIAALLAGVLWPSPGEPASPPLPRIGLLAAEAAPYAAYGLAATALLLEPHLLAWFGRHPDGTELEAFRSFELSLTLALPPLAVSAALLERLLGDFWALERRDRRATVDEVAAAVARRGSKRLRVYVGTLVLLTALTLAAVGGVRIAGAAGDVDLLVFGCGLLAYALFGCAQLTCLLMLGLARPTAAAVPFLTAIGAGVVAGVPLALIDLRLVALAFVVAALACLLATRRQWRVFLGGIDHFYASAF